MNLNPKVSLIMPNYNYGSYLKDAIEAVLRQSYTSFEFIIIDDASTDNSLDIITPYLKKHPFIHLIKHEQNQGMFKSIKDGLKVAQGEYLYVMPSDDLIFPTFLEKHVRILDTQPNIGLCCSKYAYFRSDNPSKIYSIDLLKSEKELYLSPRELIKKIKTKKFWIPGNTALTRKELFIKYGGLESKYYSNTDWFLLLKIGFSHGICYLPETLAAMRKHELSYSVTRPITQKYEAWRNMIQFLSISKNKALNRAFLKSHSFYNFDLEFFNFMLQSPRYLRFFKHHMWTRFFFLWLRKKLKPKL